MTSKFRIVPGDMPRRILTIAFSLATLATSEPAAAAEKFLLVSWDGASRSAIRELVAWQPADEAPRACPSQRFPTTMPVRCGEHWTCMPNLCAFQLIDSWDSEGKPLTRPQHAQMLSGYSPVTTGVTRNNGSDSMPPGFTVYERLKAVHGARLKTVHIAGRKYVSRGVTGFAARNGAIDFYGNRGGPDNRTGANTTKRALPALRAVAGGPFFAFVHYKEPDVTAHLNSVRSPSYLETLVMIDRELGALIAELTLLGVMPQTSILVTTDHGFTGRFHVARTESNVATWMAALNLTLRTDRYAKLLDVTPTVLDYFGIASSSVSPTLEGRSLIPSVGTTPTTTTTSLTAPPSTFVTTTTNTTPAP
jgi:hypothetical protein